MDRLDLHARILRNLKIVHSNIGRAENLLNNYAAIFSHTTLEEFEAATREAAKGSEALLARCSATYEWAKPDTWKEDAAYLGTTAEEDPS